MEDITVLRERLDKTDRELVRLFEERMKTAREVAAYKISRGLPVLDSAREAQVLDTRASLVKDEKLRPAVRELFVTMMALSRAEQEKLMQEAEKHA